MITDWGRNYIISSAFGLTTVRSEWWIALLTREPTEYNNGEDLYELAGWDYARAYLPNSELGWKSQALGLVSNLTTIEFPQASGEWQPVGFYALLSASSGGDLLAWNALSEAEVVAEGGVARFEPQSLWFTLGEVT